MIPSRLVSLRRYPSYEAAQGDRQLLERADIPSYVKSTGTRGLIGGGAELMVDEARVADAARLLALSPPIFDHPSRSTNCPHCGAPNAVRRQPFGGAVLGGGFVAALALALSRRESAALIVCVGAGIVSAMLAEKLPPKCRACGRSVQRPR